MMENSPLSHQSMCTHSIFWAGHFFTLCAKMALKYLCHPFQFKPNVSLVAVSSLFHYKMIKVKLKSIKYITEGLRSYEIVCMLWFCCSQQANQTENWKPPKLELLLPGCKQVTFSGCLLLFKETHLHIEIIYQLNKYSWWMCSDISLRLWCLNGPMHMYRYTCSILFLYFVEIIFIKLFMLKAGIY